MEEQKASDSTGPGNDIRYRHGLPRMTNGKAKTGADVRWLSPMRQPSPTTYNLVPVSACAWPNCWGCWKSMNSSRSEGRSASVVLDSWWGRRWSSSPRTLAPLVPVSLSESVHRLTTCSSSLACSLTGFDINNVIGEISNYPSRR